jgi:hypothetical protein
VCNSTNAPKDSAAPTTTVLSTSITTDPFRSLCAQVGQLAAEEHELSDKLTNALANHSPDAGRLDQEHSLVELKLYRAEQKAVDVMLGRHPNSSPTNDLILRECTSTTETFLAVGA